MGKAKINERSPLPDILKGIAVILMIQVHLMQLFATEALYYSIVGKVSLFLGGPPAAPVFMVIMGYFIAKSERGFTEHLIRGLKLIGLGFLLNIGLNLNLLVKIITGSSSQNPWPFIFGVDILFLAGIGIIVIGVARLVFRRRIVPYAVLALMILLIGQALPVYSGSHEWIEYVMAFLGGDYPWSYFPVFPWLAYPVTGFLFCVLDEKYNLMEVTTKGKSYIMITVLLMVMVTFGYGFNISGNLEMYYHHSLIFYLWVLIFLIFWVLALSFLFDERYKTFLSGYFKWTGKNVTTFYVVQWLIIGNLATILYRSQNILELMLWFTAILTATSLIVFSWEEVKNKISNPRSDIS
jgi:uncharacterized membrane protein